MKINKLPTNFFSKACQYVSIVGFWVAGAIGDLIKETMKENKIFISHAAPHDNYFAAWLASKLRLLGFEVWVELDELKSGDAFWPEIEDAIRNQSVKFVCVISEGYMSKIKDPSSGIFKELSCADRVKGPKNFKTPIRIADINEDDYPVQIMGLNSIDFYENWQLGLERLLESFTKEKIPKDETKHDNPLNFWLDSFGVKEAVTKEPEKIFSNWFPFQLPEKLYVHKPTVQSKVDLADILYSFVEYSDRHIAFFPKECYPETITCTSSVELPINEILSEKIVPIDDFLLLNEPRKKIIELVNKTFEDFLIQRRLKKYKQAKSNVFYYPNNTENTKRVSLKHIGRTNVAITGKAKENVWSFAISPFATLHPFPCVRISSHIVFESTNRQPLEADVQHTLRRKFAFGWYNRDWLNILLGMMAKISANEVDNKLCIPISPTAFLEINTIPFNEMTDFGYNEPAKIEANDE